MKQLFEFDIVGPRMATSTLLAHPATHALNQSIEPARAQLLGTPDRLQPEHSEQTMDQMSSSSMRLTNNFLNQSMTDASSILQRPTQKRLRLKPIGKPKSVANGQPASTAAMPIVLQDEINKAQSVELSQADSSL